MGGAEAKKTNTADTAKTDTQNATAAKAETKGATKKADIKERQTFERQRGSQWTLERCRKYARRYKSETEWIAGSPASYKAATYWNWVEQCCEHMPTNLRLVHSTTGATTTAKTVKKNGFKVVAGAKASAHRPPGGNPTNPPTAPAPAGNVHPLKKEKTRTDKSTGTKKKKAS